jgi:hypothetical protein
MCKQSWQNIVGKKTNEEGYKTSGAWFALINQQLR